MTDASPIKHETVPNCGSYEVRYSDAVLAIAMPTLASHGDIDAWSKSGKAGIFRPFPSAWPMALQVGSCWTVSLSINFVSSSLQSMKEASLQLLANCCAHNLW